MFDTNKIVQALKDYNKYTDTEVEFEYDALGKLASSAYYGKANLRKMLRKHPNWDEELWAVKVPIELTREDNSSEIENQIFNIFKLNRDKFYSDASTCYDIADWVAYVVTGRVNQNDYANVPVSMINTYPKAWHKGRKLTKILRDIFIAYGVWSDEPGDFQRQYAALTDMLRIDSFKTTLYISINPCHFLTMSNPKDDRRGDMLTSCHSLNNFEYDYNNGCTGYARDDVTMICFTAADPKNPETLNNRKTSRQLFMYEPGSGILLQSRMYNSEGGTRGVNQWSKTYFEAVSKVINECEDTNTAWESRKYVGYITDSIWFMQHDDFGGYPDWEYEEFNPMLHYREDIIAEDMKCKFVVGKPGLCLKCGDDISEKVYCWDCYHEPSFYCEDCGWDTDDEDDLCTVYSNGESHQVCASCRNNNYTYCDYCDEYHRNDEVHYDINDDNVCNDCVENERVVVCADCGGYVPTDEAYLDEDDGQYYCSDCYEDHESDEEEE